MHVVSIIAVRRRTGALRAERTEAQSQRVRHLSGTNVNPQHTQFRGPAIAAMPRSQLLCAVATP